MGRTHSKKSSKHCPTCSCRRHCAPAAPPQKLKITASRVTLPPPFLATTKSPQSAASPPENEGSALNLNRRSWRLSQKTRLVAENSKSIFKEIKIRYEEKLHEEFEEGLFKQLRNVKLHDNSHYKNKVLKNIEHVNNLLVWGRMSGNRKRAYNDEEKENYPMKLPYIPKSNWVFQTPPNRKLNYKCLNIQDDTIQPAVLENNKVVYEINKKINVDLTGFSNRQEIDIDKRYMVETGGQEDEKRLDFLSDQFELENHFLSLTCRPKKMVTVMPRHNCLRSKRDIFEPQPGCSTDVDFKPNFCFLENNELNESEESFTFQFTSSDTTTTTGQMFDFDGNKKNTFNFRF